MFKVVRELKSNRLNMNNLTAHCNLRHYRKTKCDKVIKCFLVDKCHPNGLEEHFVLADASIIIVNHNTKKVVTILRARLGQLKRYHFAISRSLKNYSLINEEFQLNK